MLEDVAAQAAQSFAYEVREDSVVILRCFSRDSRAEIPEWIGSYQVAELGAYAFSEHFEEEKLEREIREGRVKLYVPEALDISFGCTKRESAEKSGIVKRSGEKISPPGQEGALSEETVLSEEAVHSEEAMLSEETMLSGEVMLSEEAMLSGETMHSDETMHSEEAVFSTVICGEYAGKAVLPPPLCGERLEEIVLPLTVRRVGRYCFYNCGNLRRLEFYGGLSDWGSGAFTGCHGVRSLRVYADVDGRSHLKDVLDELREELEVEYFMEPAGGSRRTEQSESIIDKRKNGASGFARLIFPEFYEEGVENTPARILENHVHGSGILYRNCFRGRALDLAQYDALFPHAKAWESKELVLCMALARLRAPQGLTQMAKEQYETYLTEHAVEAGCWLLGQRDLEGLRFLLALIRSREDDGMKIKTPSASGAGVPAGEREDDKKKAEHQMSLLMPGQLLRALLEEASRVQYMEAVSYLMEYGREHRTTCPSHRRRLKL